MANVDFQVRDDQAEAIYVISGQTVQTGAKSKIAAGVLAILLGGLGIHKFYIGANGAGVIMLLVFIVGLIFAGVPSAIVAIIVYLTRTDEDFYQTYGLAPALPESVNCQRATIQAPQGLDGKHSGELFPVSTRGGRTPTRMGLGLAGCVDARPFTGKVLLQHTAAGRFVVRQGVDALHLPVLPTS